MQDRISLVRATGSDVTLLHRLQVESFMHLYEKYHDDDTNPVKESEERRLKKIEDSNADLSGLERMKSSIIR